MSQKLVQDIAKEGYAHALEISQLVEVMKRQTNQVRANLFARGAALAAEMVRNSLIARITLLVAGAYSRARKGDKHIGRAFEILNSYPEIRATFLQNGFNKALDEAETLWRQLNADSRLTIVKHFRDKSTAHLAEPDPSVSTPKFRDFFAFAEDTASLMEKLSLATGNPEKLDDMRDEIAASAEAFWKPWESAEFPTDERR